MNILNNYCCIGGNRKLWGSEHKITAIEIDPEIAKIYQDNFPEDNVVIGDAHQYLLDHFEEFDFIWSSPPCQTHSQIRFNLGVKNRGTKPIYPDMKLYEEILLLQYYFKGDYVIENTRSFYDPLVKPQFVGGHYLWSNVFIENYDIGNRNHSGTVETLQNRKGFDLSKYEINGKRQILRNCVEPELGKYILDCVINNRQQSLF